MLSCFYMGRIQIRRDIVKKTIITIIIISFLTNFVSATTDPNTLTMLPVPGTEKYTIPDGETIRITTSKDVKRSDLIKRKLRNLKEIERLQKENAIIDAMLKLK